MGANKPITLINNETISASGNGSTKSTVSEVGGRAALFVGFLKWGTISGASPSFTFAVQHSPDGTNWKTITALTFANVTTSDSFEIKEVGAASNFPLLPFVRATYTKNAGTNLAGVTMQLFADIGA